MQVIRSSALASIVISNLAYDLALAHQPAADDTVGVELVWIHVHIPHAYMHCRRIDEQVDGFLLARTQDEAVMYRDHLMPIRLTAIGSVVEQGARARP